MNWFGKLKKPRTPEGLEDFGELVHDVIDDILKVTNGRIYKVRHRGLKAEAWEVDAQIVALLALAEHSRRIIKQANSPREEYEEFGKAFADTIDQPPPKWF